MAEAVAREEAPGAADAAPSSTLDLALVLLLGDERVLDPLGVPAMQPQLPTGQNRGEKEEEKGGEF